MHILDTLEQCHLFKIRHYCDPSISFTVAPFENLGRLPPILGIHPSDDLAINVLRPSLVGVESFFSWSLACSHTKEQWFSSTRFKLKPWSKHVSLLNSVLSDTVQGTSSAISFMDVSVPTV
jgi:hypothetical protein